MDLLQKLITIQKAKGLSDRAFGRKLGISGAMWNQIRRGERAVRFEVLAGVVQEFGDEFPGLKDDVLNFLATAERGKREVLTA